jgi:ankyrin repeat protein
MWADWTPKPHGGLEFIAVMTIAGAEESKGVCFIPPGERIVMVETNELLSLPATLSGKSGNGSPVDVVNILTICLLHEAGHLVNRDSDVHFGSDRPHGFNAEDTPRKNIELRADRFAAEQLREAMAPSPSEYRYEVATMVATFLLEWPVDLSVRRLEERIEHSTDNSADMYLDQSYTHPNLELRLLIMNRYCFPDASGHGVVDQFLVRRKEAAADAIHRAVKAGNHATVASLLAIDPTLIARKDSEEGYTPLMWAAAGGDKNMIAFLLSHGSRVNEKTTDGVTPLHLAVGSRQTAAVTLLLSKGADSDARTQEGDSPLFFAAAAHYLEGVDLLLSNGAPINASDSLGVTPLQAAAAEGYLEVVARFLARGANINAADKVGFTPLHDAVRQGHLEVVELLLSKGADIHSREVGGFTALHLAAFNGRQTIAQLLVSKGADLGARDENGDTPCQVAINEGHAETAEFLCGNK